MKFDKSVTDRLGLNLTEEDINLAEDIQNECLEFADSLNLLNKEEPFKATDTLSVFLFVKLARLENRIRSLIFLQKNPDKYIYATEKAGVALHGNEVIDNSVDLVREWENHYSNINEIG